MYESIFCDTIGVDRLHKDQTLIVRTQTLVDSLVDKINSFHKNDLSPSSASTYNFNKGPFLCDKSINTLYDPLIDDSTLGDVFTLDSFLYYLFAYDDNFVNFEMVLRTGSNFSGWFPCLSDDYIWVRWILGYLMMPFVEIMKQVYLMVPNRKVALPFGYSKAIKTFVFSLSLAIF